MLRRMDPATAHQLSLIEFQAAIQTGREIYQPLLDRHPELGAKLVISCRKGECESDSSLPQMLLAYPELFILSPIRDAASASAERVAALWEKRKNVSFKHLPEIDKALGRESERFAELATGLLIDGTCRFELRFVRLDFAALRDLKQHPLVDQRLTDPSDASIRIVLAAIAEVVGRRLDFQS